MKRYLVGLLGVALLLPAQKIETETDSQDRVVKVQTAMSHITLIQAPGDITRTAIGSKAFQVERQGNLVLIQPLQEGAATNLFVWVGDRRFNYELLPPVNDAGQMDFAIDYRRATPATPATSSLAPPPVPPNPLSNIPAEMLMKGTPVTSKENLTRARQSVLSFTISIGPTIPCTSATRWSTVWTKPCASAIRALWR
jgi:hypothetical protein